MRSGGPTIWELQGMARDGRFRELDDLFDNGLTMKALPTGIAAGTAFGVYDSRNRLIVELTEWIAASQWRGKIICPSSNLAESEGRNRLREHVLRPNSRFVPMAKIDALLVDRHPLAPGARSNMVVIAYPRPLTGAYFQERLLTLVGVLDMMVAVQGRYGPVFVGKTWLGSYDREGTFNAWTPSRVSARYFLDFNREAIEEQRRKHWDGSEELMP